MKKCDDRSKRFVEAEDEESGMHKKKAAEKKGVEGKRKDVRGESSWKTKESKEQEK